MSTILSAVESIFKGIFNKILGPTEAQNLEDAVINFVKTDVGKLAVDAVQLASATIGDNASLRATAVAALKADLQKAGKDAETIGESTLNLFVEMAYTYVSGIVKAKTSTPAPTNSNL